MSKVEKTAGKTATAGQTANGGARCVAWSYAANAGLALGGAALVARFAPDGITHALTLGALLAAAGGCLAIALMIGASLGREVR